jgi:hypothetical protein
VFEYPKERLGRLWFPGEIILDVIRAIPETMSHGAARLITFIALAEDDRNHEGPVKFMNGDLIERLNCSEDAFVKHRREAAASGLLVWHRPTHRGFTYYYVQMPSKPAPPKPISLELPPDEEPWTTG